MRFWKLRQGAYESYLQACKPLSVRQVNRPELATSASFCAERQVKSAARKSLSAVANSA